MIYLLDTDVIIYSLKQHIAVQENFLQHAKSPIFNSRTGADRKAIEVRSPATKTLIGCSGNACHPPLNENVPLKT